MPVIVHLFYVGSYFQNSPFAGRSFWVWNCEFLVRLFHTWKPTMEQTGFSLWRHGAGIRVHLMYMKMVNGEKTNATKLFNSSTYSGTVCPPKFWNRITLQKMKRTSETETRNSETHLWRSWNFDPHFLWQSASHPFRWHTAIALFYNKVCRTKHFFRLSW